MNNGNGTNGTPGRGGAEAALSPGLSERLRSLRVEVPPDEIFDLWVFPPLAELEDSREFVLFTRLLPDEMRRVCAAEFPEGAGAAVGGGAVRNGHTTGNGNGNGDGTGAPGAPAATLRITEYGRVPSGRVSRVVDGFRRRLGDDREPLHFRFEGRPESWDRLLAPDDSDR